jgi:hypothetical protein
VQTDLDRRVAQVEVRVVVGRLGGRADPFDQREPGGEVLGRDAGGYAVEQKRPAGRQRLGDLRVGELGHGSHPAPDRPLV